VCSQGQRTFIGGETVEAWGACTPSCTLYRRVAAAREAEARCLVVCMLDVMVLWWGCEVPIPINCLCALRLVAVYFCVVALAVVAEAEIRLDSKHRSSSSSSSRLSRGELIVNSVTSSLGADNFHSRL
jgi:hypothetical protein